MAHKADANTRICIVIAPVFSGEYQAGTDVSSPKMVILRKIALPVDNIVNSVFSKNQILLVNSRKNDYNNY